MSLPLDPARGEGLYRALFDQSYQATWVLTPDGAILSANRRARAIMGRADGGIGLGAVDVAFPSATSASRAALAFAIAAALEGEPSRILVEDIDTRHEPRFHEASLRGAGGEPGAPLYLLLEALDVTERRRVEERLGAARLAAEAADRAKSAFLARMSHEMRTPLHSVLGFARLLLESATEPPARAALAQIEQSGQRLLQLVEDVLELASIEAGGLPVVDAPTDIALLLRQLDERFGRSARAKGLDFVIEVDESLPAWLRLDEAKVRRALGDLLDNAVKFTQSGAVSLRVNWEPGGRSKRLAFEIVDSGPGIERDQVERLLSSFEVVRIGRAATGTGLGLALARRLVLLIGGEFRIESSPGRGTQILLELPAPPVDEGAGESLGRVALDLEAPVAPVAGLERLAGLPRELREELRTAAQRADWDRLAAVVTRVATLDAGAGGAAAAALERFDYDALLRALPESD